MANYQLKIDTLKSWLDSLKKSPGYKFRKTRTREEEETKPTNTKNLDYFTLEELQMINNK